MGVRLSLDGTAGLFLIGGTVKPHRTIVALVYGSVYHIAVDGVTLCGMSTRDPWAAATSRHEWTVFPEPPVDMRECKGCGASTRRFVGESEEE